MNYTELKFKSGSIYEYIYTKQDDHILYNKIISDIFYNLVDFDDSIFWLRNARPNEGFSLKDIVLDYIQQFGNSKLIFAQAGTIINNFPSEGLIDLAKNNINNQRKALYDSNFINVIFNRKMAHSFMNTDIFVYFNEAGNFFIENNIGDVHSNKIINRIIQSEANI